MKKGEFDFDAVMMKRRSVYQMRMDNAVNLNWDLAYERHIMGEQDYIYELKNISKKQIVDAANEIFKTNNLIVAIKGRKKEIDVEKINEILKKID